MMYTFTLTVSFFIIFFITVRLKIWDSSLRSEYHVDFTYYPFSIDFFLK